MRIPDTRAEEALRADTIGAVESQTLQILAAAAVVAASAALLLAALSWRRASAAQRLLASLEEEGERATAGRVLPSVVAAAAHLKQRVDASNHRIKDLEDLTATAVRRVGLVHFQAFEDVGGGQSSALALLDDAGNGVVVTSLHARVGTRMYVKRITDGEGETLLGDEERQAVDEALPQRRSRRDAR